MILPNLQFRRDKELLRLEREYSRLSRARWNAPLVPLEHPFASGWIKSFVLREDILRRKDATIFRRILYAVNDRVYSRNRQFVRKDGRSIVLRPKILTVKVWRGLGWPESYKKHFQFGCWTEGRRSRFVRPITGYKLAEPWMLVEKIEPYIVTKVQADFPEIRRRLAEIEAQFSRTQAWPRLARLHGRSHSRWSRGESLLWEKKLEKVEAD